MRDREQTPTEANAYPLRILNEKLVVEEAALTKYNKWAVGKKHHIENCEIRISKLKGAIQILEKYLS